MSDQLTPAQQAALEQSQKETGAPIATPEPSGVTTVQEMLSRYQRKQITLPGSQWIVEIQSLPPGDYLSIYGSALRAMMTAAGLDYTDGEARSDFHENLTRQQRDSIADHNLRNYRRIVAKAIVSIPVSLDEQHLCPPGVLSVHQIADADILFIYDEVDKLSGWSADADRFQGTVDDNRSGGAGTD